MTLNQKAPRAMGAAGILDDVERGADLRSHLERYATLPAEFIRANGVDQVAPSLHAIDGGRR
jgi:hypothetical protein